MNPIFHRDQNTPNNRTYRRGEFKVIHLYSPKVPRRVIIVTSHPMDAIEMGETGALDKAIDHRISQMKKKESGQE